MKLVDLNVLMYAVNVDAPNHEVVRAGWEELLDGDETIGLPWMVLLGFLRLTTNPRAFPRPLAPETALARIDTWLARENVTVPRDKDDHWTVLRNLLEKSGTAGNLTTDAHLAALTISHDAVLVTTDTDFARFEGLRIENPLRRGQRVT